MADSDKSRQRAFEYANILKSIPTGEDGFEFVKRLIFMQSRYSRKELETITPMDLAFLMVENEDIYDQCMSTLCIEDASWQEQCAKMREVEKRLGPPQNEHNYVEHHARNGNDYVVVEQNVQVKQIVPQFREDMNVAIVLKKQKPIAVIRLEDVLRLDVYDNLIVETLIEQNGLKHFEKAFAHQHMKEIRSCFDRSNVVVVVDQNEELVGVVTSHEYLVWYNRVQDRSNE